MCVSAAVHFMLTDPSFFSFVSKRNFMNQANNSFMVNLYNQKQIYCYLKVVNTQERADMNMW